MIVAHVAGLPVEEALAASPGLLAVGGAALAIARARMGQSLRRRSTRSAASSSARRAAIGWPSSASVRRSR